MSEREQQILDTLGETFGWRFGEQTAGPGGAGPAVWISLRCS
jgi:hypothetical protein